LTSLSKQQACAIIGAGVCRLAERGAFVPCKESSVSLAVSVEKSARLNHLVNSADHARPKTAGQFACDSVKIFVGTFVAYYRSEI